MLEKKPFHTPDPILTSAYCAGAEDTVDSMESLNQPTFLALSIATEQTMESAMKHLNSFGERLEEAKALLSMYNSRQTSDAEHSMDVTMYNINFVSQSQLIQDMLKLGDDIRDLKERILFSRNCPYSMSSLQQTFQTLKKNNVLDTSSNTVKKGSEEVERLSKENYLTFERDLMTRFPILSSELSISQTGLSNSRILMENNSDFNVLSIFSHMNTSDISELAILDHFNTDNELFLNDTILNTEVSWESIPEFYQSLDFDLFLDDKESSLSLNMANNNVRNIDSYFSCIEPQLFGRLFEAMKRLSIGSLSNENIHNINKSYTNKLKIEAALKILEDE
ncbi:hypothetical protein PCANB_002576 [Pneumocystis canis]|nr:hypothetical protein PCANB_002576 [Pneumocystis canis]